MNDIGVVLRVPGGTHSKLKNACAKHDRSMQKIVLSLIEDWIANGSPDPHASDGIAILTSEVKKLEARLNKLEMYQNEPF